MKHIIIILLIGIGFSACTEQECCALPEEVSVIGTWKLSKLCFSNGASSCNEEDMWDADQDARITFTDTEFTFDTEGVICSGTYVVSNDTNVELTATGGDCSFETNSYFLGRLTATEMMFSPLCIEGCPHLYIRQ